MPARGFTLIELLVVIAIAGVMLSMATLAVTSRSRQEPLAEEAARLTAVTGLLLDRAALRSETQGLALSGRGYTALQPDRDDPESWHGIDGAPLEGRRELPRELALELTLDGLPVALPGTPPEKPQLWFTASGETTPFRLLLRGEGTRCELVSDGWPDRLAASCSEQ